MFVKAQYSLTYTLKISSTQIFLGENIKIRVRTIWYNKRHEFTIMYYKTLFQRQQVLLERGLYHFFNSFSTASYSRSLIISIYLFRYLFHFSPIMTKGKSVEHLSIVGLAIRSKLLLGTEGVPLSDKVNFYLFRESW